MEWSKPFGNCDYFTNPPRTQGFKHITLPTKKQRVKNVNSKRISSHRLYQVNLSRIEKKNKKLATENYAKSKKRKFSYQKPSSGVKLDNIINKVSSHDSNKKIPNKEKK